MRFFGLVAFSIVLLPPLTAQTEPPPDQGFKWLPAVFEAFEATAIAHTVRVTTEDDTESELGGPFLANYFHSIENVHGFDDGDALYTTWILHPMEGAAAGFIEQQNDPAYRDVEFGDTQRYWISRMRALAFAAAYSTQWTLGPISEASIGNVQHYAPPGVDDLVVTPILGIGWMVGEDAMDRYVIRWIEARTQNRVIRLLARSTLNPMRSYANILRFQAPWHRDSRGGILVHDTPLAESPATMITATPAPRFDPEAWPKSVAFELASGATYERFLGSTGSNCIGGGGDAGIRVADQWAVVFRAGGCELMGFKASDTSGDTLWYLTGGRYSKPLHASSRFHSYVEGLAGGMKIVHDHIDEALKEELIATAEKAHKPPPPTIDYTNELDTNALSLELGLGVTWNLNHAAVLRLCSVDYQHSWNRNLEGLAYNNGLQVSAGMSLRLGRWGTQQ